MAVSILCASLALAVHTPARLAQASRLVSAVFPGEDSYWDRLAIGRAAQLGTSNANPIVYVPGSIGCSVDTSLTYGEFDLEFFATLTNEALTRGGRKAAGQTFVDVGSGCGRLVFAAAALWPTLDRCIGIEVVELLHTLALEATPRAKSELELVNCDVQQQQPEVHLVCEDALQGLARLAGGVPVCAFAYSSTWPCVGMTLTDFSLACSSLPPGSRVVTIDKVLAIDDPCLHGSQLLATLEGPNTETGGTSLGYIWEIGNRPDA
eukprot:scaffold301132_cov35-Tisochrysis_lutea.AAC.1